MKVGHVTERSDSSTASSILDNDELERTGIDLGTTGRLQLMARLAEGLFCFRVKSVIFRCEFYKWERFLPPGTGLKIPPAAQQALQMTGSMSFPTIGGPPGDT